MKDVNKLKMNSADIEAVNGGYFSVGRRIDSGGYGGLFTA